MKIEDVIQLLKDNKILKEVKGNIDKDVEVTDITYNSKECKKNCIFFAKGANFKAEYVIDAKNNGAIAVISENEYNSSQIFNILVDDIREAMVVIANEFFGRAYESLNIIGITGTKGKTTTTYYLKNILEEYVGKKVGLISTIGVYTGTRDEEAHLTTPEAIELQRYIKEVKDNNLKFLAMEVSSQGYKTKRIEGITFDIGVFLNISEDHISPAEHPNFNDYLNCKLQFIRNCKKVVININTDYYESVREAAKNADDIITYGNIDNKDKVDYYIDNVIRKDSMLEFTVHGKNYEATFNTKMLGRFNVENALAAIILAKNYNIPDEFIRKGIEKTEVKGRMNIFEKNGITVIVDYAHNKLSFEKLFETIKLDYPNSRVITVAGGPGGKAYARRKDLGEIASKNSDYMYLTMEDPQFEEVKKICNEIASYVTCDYEIIEDRKEAVEKAINNAKRGDVIALLAKGEETYQKVNGKFIPYESDLLIAERMMK